MSSSSRRCSALTGLLILLLVSCFSEISAFAPVSLSSGSSTTSETASSITNKHHQQQQQHRHQQKQQWYSGGRPSQNQQYQPSQQRNQSGSHHKTRLFMANPATAAAIVGALTGGLFSGGLHAIAGPDHLAALLPRCVGQRWYHASRIGALWGMGHGISATLIGSVAFFFKNRMSKVESVQGWLSNASSITEIAVGLSLIIIGLMGMKEAREWESDLPAGGSGGAGAVHQPQSLSAAAVLPDTGIIKTAQKRAVVFNGLLHGFSWDGAPSLAPALAVATWRGNLAFLLAYALGTIGVMTLATTVIGEGTRRAGEIFHRPDIPQKLSFFSSILAVIIGVIWCAMPLMN